MHEVYAGGCEDVDFVFDECAVAYDLRGTLMLLVRRLEGVMAHTGNKELTAWTVSALASAMDDIFLSASKM